MKDTRIIMGMPVTVEILDLSAQKNDLEEVFSYFQYVDENFSKYKKTSEVSKINNGEIRDSEYSEDMKTVLKLSEETKNLTDGYFDIVTPEGKIDPSGLVKGWAIHEASKLLEAKGFQSYYIEAGGDIQPHGVNSQGEKWRVGIRNPFKLEENVKVLYLGEEGIATSGTYLRGQHIYDPLQQKKQITEVVSLTVIGPNIYEADRFATAAFAMRENGIDFIERLDGFEGYLIDKNGQATMTSGFEKYTIQ